MKLTALVDLPNGVLAGEEFEVPDYQGQVLLGAKVARSDDPTVVIEDDAAVIPPPMVPRQRYRRRDLTADTSENGE